ncbi:MAG: DUF4112 domain-containing protein [Bacteroidota bacterium]
MKASSNQKAMADLSWLATLMDSRFKIPGTNIRFGLDALIGLIPGAGDFATLLVSGYMITLLAKNGASGFVLARMVLNVGIDWAIGAIPLIGDIFDIYFKANQRNMTLLRQHYVEGRHQGSAWKLIVPVMIMLLVFMAVIVWISYKLVVWVAKGW